jgi:protein-disulfide isomerase
MSRKPQMSRRSVLTTTGSLALLGGAGLAASSTSAAASVGDVPVPDDADNRTYPTMGTNSDAPTATVYGNSKCPVTEEFVHGNLETIIEEFVETGRLNIEYRNLAYDPGSTSSHFISDSDPRIAAAGLGVWDEDSDSYWQFFQDTFANRPTGHVTYDDMESRASSAGASGIGGAEDGQYDGAVDQAATEAGDDGVSFTPQLELDGEVTAPHHSVDAIRNWLESRVDEASAEAQTEETESEESEDEASEPEESEEESTEEESESEDTEEESEDESSEEEEEDESEDESEDSEEESEDESETAESETDSKTESADEDDEDDDDDDDVVEECPF